MSAVAAADSARRAREVRAFLRAKGGGFRPTIFQLYATVLGGAIGGALLAHAVSTMVGGGLGLAALVAIGPIVLSLALLGAIRFGIWQGPVVFSAPAVSLLLTAPIAIGALVGPKLDRSLLLGAAVGAMVALFLLLLIHGGFGAVGPARSVCAVLGGAAYSTLLVACSWLVECTAGAARVVRRASPVALVAIGGLGALAAGGGEQLVGLWSGPWGWALAPLGGVAGWPLAFLLGLFASALATVLARRAAAGVGAKPFVARAETRTALLVSTLTLDYRGAALAHRSALPAIGGRALRIPRPVRSRYAVPWRDALAFSRDRGRLGWAAIATAAGTVEILTHPGDLLPAALGALGLYIAAALLCEPLHMDVDDPDRGRLLLGIPFARLLLAHCALPVLLVSGFAAVTIGGLVISGSAGPAVLLAIPTLLVPVVSVAVLAAALATRRGGRIDESLQQRIATIDPSNPAAGPILVVLLVPWLIAAVAVIAVATTVIGGSAGGGHGLAGSAAVGAAATVGIGVAAAALLALASRSGRGGRFQKLVALIHLLPVMREP